MGWDGGGLTVKNQKQAMSALLTDDFHLLEELPAALVKDIASAAVEYIQVSSACAFR